jgi:hypothetical protein
MASAKRMDNGICILEVDQTIACIMASIAAFERVQIINSPCLLLFHIVYTFFVCLLINTCKIAILYQKFDSIYSNLYTLIRTESVYYVLCLQKVSSTFA